MVTSFSRGHSIYYAQGLWKYTDNNEPLRNDRSCKRCGQLPTQEGFDACFGYIEDATSACCGHGAGKHYIIKGGDADCNKLK